MEESNSLETSKQPNTDNEQNNPSPADVEHQKLLQEAETLAMDLMTVQGKSSDYVITELIRFGLTNDEAEHLYAELSPFAHGTNVSTSNKGIGIAIAILIVMILITVIFGGVFGIVAFGIALLNLFYNIYKRIKA